MMDDKMQWRKGAKKSESDGKKGMYKSMLEKVKKFLFLLHRNTESSMEDYECIQTCLTFMTKFFTLNWINQTQL